ncbi:MAG: hypothetical protein NWQ23_16520, partial [Yoonia sp.]|uniref:hypothetical protein n=1 Tax=Yoonia sp. TaxID=2212373 RepID=UPI00273E2B41
MTQSRPSGADTDGLAMDDQGQQPSTDPEESSEGPYGSDSAASTQRTSSSDSMTATPTGGDLESVSLAASGAAPVSYRIHERGSFDLGWAGPNRDASASNPGGTGNDKGDTGGDTGG